MQCNGNENSSWVFEELNNHLKIYMEEERFVNAKSTLKKPSEVVGLSKQVPRHTSELE